LVNYLYLVPPLFAWIGLLQLLKEKGLVPELSLQVENIVCALDADLQGAAARVASILREKGRSVDLVLESKPLKWYLFCLFRCHRFPNQLLIFYDMLLFYLSYFSFRVFKRAARVNAYRLILVGSSEWQRGMVSVKILSSGEQYEVKLDELE
jgi:histidyl-tRNA synthetase